MEATNDRTEIVNLLARYCLTLDHHDIEGWVSLFTPEAHYVVYGLGYSKGVTDFGT